MTTLAIIAGLILGLFLTAAAYIIAWAYAYATADARDAYQIPHGDWPQPPHGFGES